MNAPPPAAPASSVTASASSEPKARLAPPPEAVPGPPQACKSFESSPRAKSSDALVCADSASANARLNEALGQPEPSKRDAALGELEACSAFTPGLVRALRAELAPAACADHLVAPILTPTQPVLRKDVEDALVGLATSARLERLVRTPPKFAPPYDKAHFSAFFEQQLAPWILREASAVQELSLTASKLAGYGRGIAAIAAGLADMRFVEVVREVGLPKEIAADTELKNTYYGELDQALEPRKARGRDAALVGLRELASIGLLRDARVDEARQLLSKLYAGRRIDALDDLLLPARPRPSLTAVDEQLAARLPTFYAGLIFRERDPTDVRFLAAVLERGLPLPMRARLETTALADGTRELLGRAAFELGQVYFRSPDFRHARDAYAKGGPARGDAALLAALSEVLQTGPKDAADMMVRGPETLKFGSVAPLDELAGQGGPLSGMAAYDAALILSLAPSDPSARAFFKDLAARYRRAGKLLSAPEHKKLASERARAAEDTARAIR